MSQELDDISTEIIRLTGLMNNHKGSFMVFKDYCSRSEDMQKIMNALIDLDNRLKAVEG